MEQATPEGDERRSRGEPGGAVARVGVVRVRGEQCEASDDEVAIEEPLEMRLAWSQGGQAQERTIAVTMRTPGADLDLALGFLLTEGIVKRATQVISARHCGPSVREGEASNVVRVTLASGEGLSLARLERHFYTSSSCGVCGKTSLEAVRTVAPARMEGDSAWLRASVVHAMPAELRRAQEVFSRTGGLHAAGLFDAAGRLLVLREDVGRHNAVDKVIGARLRARALPAEGQVLVVSGRASFELVQKAWMASIPVLAAVGAPSSLAVELGREAGMTIVGFLRDGRFSIYGGEGRVCEAVSRG